MDKVRIGVIGVGRHGERHVRILTKLPQAKLTAVADVDATRAKEIAENYGVPKWFSNYKELLKSDISAVIICTPDHLHRNPTIASAEAGKHILCEKPMATNLEDADQMIAVANKYGVKLMIGHSARFHFPVLKAKELITQGRIGEISMAYTRLNAPISVAKFYENKTSLLWFLGIHAIDTLRFLVAQDVVHVYAQALSRIVKKNQDLVKGILTFRNQALGSFETCWVLPEALPTRPSDIQTEIVGTKGAVYVDLFQKGVILCSERWEIPDTDSYAVIDEQPVGSVKNELEHFLRCIVYDKTPLVTGQDGRAVVEIALAAQKSIETGEPVTLPLQ